MLSVPYPHFAPFDERGTTSALVNANSIPQRLEQPAAGGSDGLKHAEFRLELHRGVFQRLERVWIFSQVDFILFASCGHTSLNSDKAKAFIFSSPWSSAMILDASLQLHSRK